MMHVRFIWFLLLLSTFVSNGFTQNTATTNPWQFTTTLRNSVVPQKELPNNFRLIQLDASELEKIISNAPLRSSEVAVNQMPVLSVPLPDGTFGSFRIVEAPVLHPDLGKQFPAIRSYAGWGIEDPSAYIRFDKTPKGFHAIILSGKQSTVIIDKYVPNNTSYLVYYKKDNNNKVDYPFSCTVKNANSELRNTATSQSRQAGDCKLRKYRLALACTGEYARYHGGTTADVLAAMNTTMTRINGIFEREVAVTMEIIPQNTAIIFLSSFSDPYSNFDGEEMLFQNQETIDEVVGTDNYDIGHVFSTAGGGIAGLGVVCNAEDKAFGVTGFDRPEGDQFDLDFVAHEIGHQFGAEHSFNGTRGSCAGNNWEATAMEPGGGSTLMSYAGICESHDLQDHSDAYFHAISLQQIGFFLIRDGDGCAGSIAFDNEMPTADAGENFIIPKSTPFVLTGTGTDADDATLLYSWEQMDNASSPQPPRPTNSTGPLFRSLEPSSSPQRYLPNLLDLVNNVSPTWEVLPAIKRDINFRLTVRDNKVGGGCTAEDDMRISVNSTAGPFLVVSPNTAVLWTQGEKRQVTWDVAGTNRSPINATEVDLFLSLDGGFTYPEVLLTNVPNTGSAEILVPGTPTKKARIMVKASDNIFFDISDRNFEIEAILDDFTVAVSSNVQEICSTEEGQYLIDVGVSGELDGTIKVSTDGLPVGITPTFSTNNFVPPAEVQLTVKKTGTIPAGMYDFTVKLEGSTGLQTRDLQVLVVDEGSSTIMVTAPTNNARGIDQNPNLEWEAIGGVINYTIRVSTSPSFDDIWEEALLSADETTYTIEKLLELNTRYYWEVMGMGECLSNLSTGTKTFVTANIACTTYDSEDIPIEISRDGTPSIASRITIPETGVITDLNILNLKIDHSFIADLAIGLVSPKEKVVKLVEHICLFEEDMNLNFDDAAPSYATIPCPPIGGGTYQSLERLEAYIGEEINGDWYLAILDEADDDGGSLRNWSLEVCYLQEGEALPLAISIDKSNETCIGSANGQATVTALDGIGAYTYLWSTGAATATIDNLNPGDYAVTISDDNTTVEASITIEAATSFGITPVISHPTCRGTATGSIELTPTNPTGIYTYQWNTEATTTVLEAVNSGAYEVTITNENGCTEQLEIVVHEPPALIKNLSVREVSCSEESDGAIILSLTNSATESPTYAWSNGATTQSINNLSAGDYLVTVTTDNCQEIGAATITSPELLEVTIKTRPITCAGLTDGQMNVEVQGGTIPYKFSWSEPTIASNLRNLAMGSYELTVTDANNCIQVATASIDEPTPIKIDAVISPISCFGLHDGRIQTNISGGTAPYTYVWSTAQDTQNLTDLTAGVYELTVRDINDCEISDTFQIEEATDLELLLSASDISSQGAEDGQLVATVAGGTGNYSYEWNNGDTTAILEDIGEGAYELTVTDENACTIVKAATVEGAECMGLSIDFSATYPVCEEMTTGAINAVISGGTAPYTYNWEMGDTVLELSNLPVGAYTLMVTDSLNCSIQATKEIIATSTITIQLVEKTDFSCQDGLLGSATVLATGGEGNYNYRWSNGQTDTTATDLVAGIYMVTATDESSCSSVLEVAIGDGSELILPAFQEAYTLYLDSTGHIMVQPDMFLLALLDSCSVRQIEISKLMFDCAELGDNPLILTTNFTNDSIVMTELSVEILDTIKPSLQCPADIVLMNACTDTVFYELTASDNCEVLELNKLKGLVSGSIFPQGTTEVSYEALDKTGNRTSCDFTVTVSTDLSLEINPESTINFDSTTFFCDYFDESIFIPKGGVPPYDTTWTPITDQVLGEDYRIVVFDSVGCSITRNLSSIAENGFFPIDFNVEAAITPATDTEEDGAIVINVSSTYLDDLEFEWYVGDSLYSREKNLLNLSAGTYLLKLNSTFGCSRTYSYTVEKMVTTATDDFNLDRELTIAPNPTKGQFQIKIALQKAVTVDVSLYNLSGRLILPSQTTYATNPSFLIDLSDFPKGLYVAKIRVGEEILLRKIVLF